MPLTITLEPELEHMVEQEMARTGASRDAVILAALKRGLGDVASFNRLVDDLEVDHHLASHPRTAP